MSAGASEPSAPHSVVGVDFALLIDPVEARRLADAARTGGEKAKRAKEALLGVFEPVVTSFVRKFAWSGVSREDLAQEARLGVLEAISSYDPAKGELWCWVALRVRWRCSKEARSVVERRRITPFDPTDDYVPIGGIQPGPEEEWIERIDEISLANALASLHRLVPEAKDDASVTKTQRRLARTMVEHPATLAKLNRDWCSLRETVVVGAERQPVKTI
jgi:DNA-directed RNA polymerase specialized sigma24 family protein